MTRVIVILFVMFGFFFAIEQSSVAADMPKNFTITAPLNCGTFTSTAHIQRIGDRILYSNGDNLHKGLAFRVNQSFDPRKEPGAMDWSGNRKSKREQESTLTSEVGDSSITLQSKFDLHGSVFISTTHISIDPTSLSCRINEENKGTNKIVDSSCTSTSCRMTTN